VSKSGQVVYDSRQIALNYIRGWFLLDLLAAIPFDLLYAFQVDTVMIQQLHACYPLKYLWVWLESHDFLKVWERSDNISKTVQDRDILHGRVTGNHVSPNR